MLLFALLAVRQNKLTEIVKRLKNLGKESINKVHLVYGEYDIIAELKVDNPEVSTELLRQIRETDGVNSLKTYVVSDQITEHNLNTMIINN